MQARLEEGLATWRQRGAGNGAIVVVDRSTGDVKASVGSADWFDNAHAGAIDYTRVARYPGSTLKPFLYAHAMDLGILTPATVLDDIQRGPDGISNADRRFLGPMLPRNALGNSRNVPAVMLLEAIGLDRGYDFFRELGLHQDQRPAEHWGLGMAIGGFPVTLQSLISAYTALAGDGRLTGIQWFHGLRPANAARVFSEPNAQQMSLFLSDPLARLPTFPRMGFSEYAFPVAVKTGTSTGFRDSWSVVWSDRYLVGVWIGHPDYLPMQELSGYRAAANLAHTLMEDLHPDWVDGLMDLSFPAPLHHQSMAICTLSGQLPNPQCDHTRTEWFATNTSPTNLCTIHQQRAIDTRTGTPATVNTPTERLEIQTVLNLPPRYAAWAVEHGLNQTTPPTEDDGELRLTITSPRDQTILVRDPEVPEERATLALSVTVSPKVSEVIWYVDGEPFSVAEYPYTVRWPLQAGTHTFQVKIPWMDVESETVSLTLR